MLSNFVNGSFKGRFSFEPDIFLFVYFAFISRDLSVCKYFYEKKNRCFNYSIKINKRNLIRTPKTKKKNQ